jgi:hypothetical protein
MKILLVLLALALPASAQSGESKNRLVFPNTGNATASTSSPTPMPALSPEQVLKQFFTDLEADKLDAAYQGLVKNTVLSGRAGTTDQLKEKTREALDHFGPVKGYEIVENLQVGDSLFRYTCVSLNEDIPLRWRFYFYRSGTQWRVIDLRVDDGIADLFDEVSRSRRK